MKTITLVNAKYHPMISVEQKSNSYGEQCLTYYFESTDGRTAIEFGTYDEGNWINKKEMKARALVLFRVLFNDMDRHFFGGL